MGYQDDIAFLMGVNVPTRPMEDKLKPQFGNQWTAVSDNLFVVSNSNYEKLVAGIYELSSHGQIPAFLKKDVKADELLEFKDSQVDSILKEIEFFWDRKEVFKEYGFLHRRGFMFAGPQGSGKSALVHQICQRIINRNGIVFLATSPRQLTMYLSIFRHVEPERPIVCVLEDIDTIISTYGEKDLLSFLDGEDKLDNILNIATTNYPERLPPRIMNRPRRFDRVITVGMPTQDMRREYFKLKLKIQDDELEMWVNNSEGFSFASMSELVISVKCLGNDFQKSADNIKEHASQKLDSEEFDGGEEDEVIGFGN